MSTPEPGTIDELVRLIAVLISREGTRGELIVGLNKVGLEPKRISELTGTSPAVVSQTLYENRKGKKK